MYPNRAPLRRAARWDGLVPMHADELFPTPDQVDDVVRTTRAHRTSGGPFDVNVPFLITGDRAGTRRLVREYEGAGATWLQLGTWTIDEMRARIGEGPPAG